jgi:tetratricopeptide (TPR) repeat protein
MSTCVRGISVLVLLAASCGGPVPPLPTPSVEGFDPEVRDAILDAHRKAESQPSSGPASGRLGMVLQAHALYQPATLAYRRAIRLDPNEFAWRYDVALSLQQLSQLDEALDAVSAALKIRSDYAPAILQRGELLYQLGRFPASASAYESLLAKEPSSASALYNLAKVKFAQQEAAAAEDLYSRACQAFPTFGAAYYGLAVVGRSLGHEAESAKNFELAKRYTGQTPPSPDPVFSEVLSLAKGSYNQLQQAATLMDAGKNEEAVHLYAEVLARDPDNLSSLMSLLYLARFVNLGDQIDALHERATRINPKIAAIQNHYGVALFRQGKLDAAAAALLKAIELNPDYAEPHLWLGEVREQQRRAPEAVEQYRLALAAQPSLSLAQFQLGRILTNLGRDREAIPYLHSLLADLSVDDSHATMVMVLLGEAYGTTGDRDHARQYLEQAQARVRSQGPPELMAEIEQELRRLRP